MKRLKKLALLTLTILFLSNFYPGTVYGASLQQDQRDQRNYENPQWAPPYYQGVRYYYLPDIETYYDINSREFVYLYNGQWCFSRECPFLNTGFDLNNSFAIALDINVFQPWMHHHYYVSHYPRYYYKDYYDHSNIPYVRGFNENSRSAFYWRENERHRARNWDNEGMHSDHKFRYSNDDRQQQNNWNRNGNGNVNRESVNDNSNHQQHSDSYDNLHGSRPSGPVVVPTTSVRTTQGTNYYGKTIGQPVRVEKQMRQRSEDHKSDDHKDENRR